MVAAFAAVAAPAAVGLPAALGPHRKLLEAEIEHFAAMIKATGVKPEAVK